MRLGIDLDGVVVNYHKAVINQLNEDYRLNLAPSDIAHWNFLDITPFKEWDQYERWFRDNVGFAELPDVPWALDTLMYLHHIRRHDIVILTHRPEWARASTYLWLGANKVPTTEVHITEHKVGVPCDIYLDDSPDQLNRLYNNQDAGKVVRFMRPWNAHLDPVTWHATVSGWNEFRELVLADERG